VSAKIANARAVPAAKASIDQSVLRTKVDYAWDVVGGKAVDTRKVVKARAVLVTKVVDTWGVLTSGFDLCSNLELCSQPIVNARSVL
jgi:hypothetical protein